MHEGGSLSATRQQTAVTRGDDPALTDKLLAAHDTAVQMFAAIESKGVLLQTQTENAFAEQQPKQCRNFVKRIFALTIMANSLLLHECTTL